MKFLLFSLLFLRILEILWCDLHYWLTRLHVDSLFIPIGFGVVIKFVLLMNICE